MDSVNDRNIEMLEPWPVDVVISSDVRRGMLKLITQRFNLLLLSSPYLWKEDGILLGAHRAYVDSNSEELSGLYFVETQPLDSIYLYFLFPFNAERDFVVECGVNGHPGHHQVVCAAKG